MDALLNELMKQTGLGGMTVQPQRVSGGYLHRMYRVETAASTYAVKCLNPEIMARPEAMGNYRRAEALEQELEDAGLPIVPALRLQGQKMQAVQGRYFYVFPWVKAKALPWEDITAEHCRIMGDLLARIHLLQKREEPFCREAIRVDWGELICRAGAVQSPLAGALAQNRALLCQAQDAFNAALSGLSAVKCISNPDMDCKNVLWRGMEPLVIDLECLDWGHPLWDMFQLALSWAGGAVGEIDGERLRAFLGAYLARWGEPGMELTALWGAGFSWLEWLAYNVRRALGLIPGDEEEHSLGEKEALATLQRIEGHAWSHDKVIRLLLVLQHGVENAI